MDPQAALLREKRRWQQRLKALDAELRRFHDASRDSNADDEHDPEGATIAFERSQAARLASDAQAQLGEVEAALDRLSEGRYGVCEGCGRPIPPERLAVRPASRTCVECAGR